MKIIYMLLGVIVAISCCAFSGDGQAPFITDLHNPVGMVYDNRNQLFIAEWGSSRVCSYDEQGIRTVIADDIGRPSGLALDNAGNLYIASYDRNIIYKKNPEGKPEIFATGFSTPAGLLWDTDSLIMANRDAGEIIRILNDGKKVVLSRGHTMPVGIAKFDDGSLVVSCLGGTVERIAFDGSINVLSNELSSPAPGLIKDGDDAVLVVDYGGTRLARVTLKGESTTIQDGFQIPVGLTRMPDGRLIVADWGRRAAYIVEN